MIKIAITIVLWEVGKWAYKKYAKDWIKSKIEKWKLRKQVKI